MYVKEEKERSKRGKKRRGREGERGGGSEERLLKKSEEKKISGRLQGFYSSKGGKAVKKKERTTCRETTICKPRSDPKGHISFIGLGECKRYFSERGIEGLSISIPGIKKNNKKSPLAEGRSERSRVGGTD